MLDGIFMEEAKRCRVLAEEFEGGSQETFLLSVAQTFDDLGGRGISETKAVALSRSEVLAHRKKLPAANTVRWTPRRKAEVVAAVAGGFISVHEACLRFSISIEELKSWHRAYDKGGTKALRVTRRDNQRVF